MPTCSIALHILIYVILTPILWNREVLVPYFYRRGYPGLQRLNISPKVVYEELMRWISPQGVWVSSVCHNPTFFLNIEQVAGILCFSSPSSCLKFSFYSWEKLLQPPNNLNLCLVILHLLNECKPLYFLSFVGLWTSASYFICGLIFFQCLTWHN